MTSPPTAGAESKSVLDTSPHLAHYVFKLLLSNQPQAQSRSTLAVAPGQHPLSVSSSGESDEDEDEPHDAASRTESSTSADESQSSSSTKANGAQLPQASSGPSREEREALVLRIIDLLDNEQEEDVKDLLREPMGEFGKVSRASLDRC